MNKTAMGYKVILMLEDIQELVQLDKALKKEYPEILEEIPSLEDIEEENSNRIGALAHYHDNYMRVVNEHKQLLVSAAKRLEQTNSVILRELDSKFRETRIEEDKGTLRKSIQVVMKHLFESPHDEVDGQ